MLVAVAMVGFNQNWHVEEERPIAGGEADAPAAYQGHEDACRRTVPRSGPQARQDAAVDERPAPEGEDVEPPPDAR